MREGGRGREGERGRGEGERGREGGGRAIINLLTINPSTS